MTDYLFIDNATEAAALAADWAGASRLAVDTEFVRESTYRARLCLLQISDGERIACIDTLALGGPGVFTDLLLDPGVRKIFHAARQDLEVLHDHLGTVPGPVWDTQVAAAMLGHPDQVGYTQLTGAELGVTLPKDHARTDWSRRPLSPEQLHYAAADVEWLLPLADRLAAALAARGRLEWAEAESASLCDSGLYAFDDAGAWRRVKGASRLDAPALGRLAALAAWREREARDRDRPRRWILKDEDLVALAERNPSDREALARDTRLPPASLQRLGDVLLDVLRATADVPPPATAIAARLEPAQERLVKQLLARLREIAESAQVSAPMIATRKDIEALVRGGRDLALLQGWRRALAGEALLGMTERAGAAAPPAG
jgi:ribonuclease D